MKKLFFLVMAVMFGLTASMNAYAVTTSAMTTSSVTAASSSSDWDSILDSYEKYVNEYIAVYKKVQSGDMSAYSKMASLMEKYQKLAEQLENASDELTSSQLARLQKINAKLAKAIQ
ncbi:MAG: DUF6591 domain-containing protein [Paludibacteraceae bacterium]|nr:DUF6591 domain-containing protein [Paludibacteraceae bacterium]